jgi:cytochrome c biogenesis factor
MTVDPRTDVPDAREIRALWAGLLLPPIAFLINLEAAYALVPAACSSRNQLPMHLVHIACLLLALAGGLTAWRWWKLEGATWPGEEGDPVARSRFMAGLGVLLSALFILVIVAMWIPSFLLDPCQ